MQFERWRETNKWTTTYMRRWWKDCKRLFKSRWLWRLSTWETFRKLVSTPKKLKHCLHCFNSKYMNYKKNIQTGFEILTSIIYWYPFLGFNNNENFNWYNIYQKMYMFAFVMKKHESLLHNFLIYAMKKKFLKKLSIFLN